MNGMQDKMESIAAKIYNEAFSFCRHEYEKMDWKAGACTCGLTVDEITGVYPKSPWARAYKKCLTEANTPRRDRFGLLNKFPSETKRCILPPMPISAFKRWP